MIYSTYILVHPRTQQLQNVLTLEDYHQIQALLEFCLQRQQLQQQENFLQQQRQDHQNREHARLVQALHNNKLLQLDYRRQRAAQMQRLMRQHQQQLDQYDRARLVAALEKQRAQQCFRRFTQQQHQQPRASAHRHQLASDMTREQSHQQQQAPAQIKIDAAPTTITTEEQEDSLEGDDEQVDDAYEQYQTQQLEDLLKHIFEKNSKAQHQQQQHQKPEEEEEEEYAYVPRQQEDPTEDEQTMADLLPILNDTNRGDRRDLDATLPKRDDASTPPIPPKSMQQQQQRQQQPMETTTDDDDDDRAFLPENVVPLQDVVDDLVRIPTPAVKQQLPPASKPAKTTTTRAAMDEEDNKDRRDKLEKLDAIEQTLDRLSQQADGATHLPLQYQVNDQGGLVLDGNTSNNHQFLMLEDDIIRCMLQLDQILSDGDPVVRDRRRTIVKKAERLLEPLDQHKQAEWNKETKRQQQVLGKKKKKHHHGKRKVRVPVTA